MKNFTNLKALFILLTITAVFFTSCETDESLNPQEKIELNFSITPQVKVQSIENGMLEFNNYTDFRNTLAALSQMSHAQRINWEESLNFVSVQTIYENSIDEVLLAGSYTLTPYIKEHIELGVLKLEFIEPIETNVVEINLFNASYGVILGVEREVKIGNEVLKFGDDSITLIADGHSQVFLVKTDVVLRGTSQWLESCVNNSASEFLQMDGLFHSIVSSGSSVNSTLSGGFNTLINQHAVNLRHFIKFGNLWLPAFTTALLEGSTHCQYEMIHQTNGQNGKGQVIDLKNDYSEKFQFQGSATFMAAENGIMKAPSGQSFAGPMQLESALWAVEIANGMGCLIEY